MHYKHPQFNLHVLFTIACVFVVGITAFQSEAQWLKYYDNKDEDTSLHVNNDNPSSQKFRQVFRIPNWIKVKTLVWPHSIINIHNEAFLSHFWHAFWVIVLLKGPLIFQPKTFARPRFLFKIWIKYSFLKTPSSLLIPLPEKHLPRIFDFWDTVIRIESFMPTTNQFWQTMAIAASHFCAILPKVWILVKKDTQQKAIQTFECLVWNTEIFHGDQLYTKLNGVSVKIFSWHQMHSKRLKY